MPAVPSFDQIDLDAAYRAAQIALAETPGLCSCKTSAGLVMPQTGTPGDRQGYQVWVEICPFDERALARNMVTGVLLNQEQDA